MGTEMFGPLASGRSTLHDLLALLGGVLVAFCVWFWVQDIAIAHQLAEAKVLGMPRGNLSDLYPRWLGSRELLLHGRNPYGADITREIQVGYYGRELDATRPNDPKDQQGFAYPVYVAFLLAPTVGMPFPQIQRGFFWLLLLLTAFSVPWWMRAVGWRVPVSICVLWMVLTLGCFPTIQGLKLQQLTLLVAGLLAGAMSALAGGHLMVAGVLLALATIKPQLAVLPVVSLCAWGFGNWRERKRLMIGFGVTMIALFAGGEILLPGWVSQFRVASAAYLQYTGGGKSVLDVELTPTWGRPVAALLVCLLGYFAWRLRKARVHSADFAWLTALTMATTLMVIPMFAPYNQVLLLPALMVLARAIRPLWRAGRWIRFVLLLTAISLAWPWLMSLGLAAALLFFPAATVQKTWALPLYTNFTSPTLIIGLLLLGSGVIRGAPGALKTGS